MYILRRPTMFTFTLPIRAYVEWPVILGDLPILTPQLLIISVGISFTEIPSSYPLTYSHYIFCLSLHLLQVSDQPTGSAVQLFMYAHSTAAYYFLSEVLCLLLRYLFELLCLYNHAAHEHILRKCISDAK
jgi:hypothetical protein